MSSDSEVATWSVVEKADPFGNQSKRFRIQVIYLNGKTRMLSMAFLDRHHLDRYVSRFHPELIGKENTRRERIQRNVRSMLFNPTTRKRQKRD
jgi:hypothetical protein